MSVKEKRVTPPSSTAPTSGTDSTPQHSTRQVSAHVRQLGLETVAYGLLGAVNSFLGLLLVPLYTRVLSPADYGLVATITATASLAATFSVLGLDSAASRWFNDVDTQSWQRRLLSTWFWCQLASSVLFGALLLTLSPFVLPAIGDSDVALSCLLLASIALPLGTFRMVAGNQFRYRRRARAAAVFFAASGLMAIVAAAVFVLVFDLGVVGVFLGQSLGAALTALAGTYILRGLIAPGAFSLQLLKRLLRYSLPLIPAAIAGWVTTSSDRLLLGFMTSTIEVGLYSLAAAVASVMALLTAAFRMSWGPFAFSILDRPESGATLARVMSWTAWVGCSLAAGLSVFAPLIVRVLAPPEFHGAVVAVPYLAFSEVALLMYVVFAIGANIARTSAPVAAALAIGAAVNIPLNLVLIGPMGIAGSALATLISMALTCGVMYWLSQRLYRIDYRLVDLAVFVAGAALIVVAALAIPGESWSSQFARLGVVSLMLVLPFVTGLLSIGAAVRLVSAGAARLGRCGG